MSRRKADRAEGIVKGVGALIMLLVLAIVLFALPQILKGESPAEMVATMHHMIVWFALMGLAIGIIGLIVWIRVRKRP